MTVVTIQVQTFSQRRKINKEHRDFCQYSTQKQIVRINTIDKLFFSIKLMNLIFLCSLNNK